MSDWAGYAEPAGNADMSRHDAVVVGSGPNGLAAAITLALAGRSVLVLEAKPTPGGGMRTADLTLPGFRHDVCAAIHPMGAAGSFFSDIGVDVAWCHPEVPMAHPLDDGTAAVLLRSVGETADANDSPRWRRYVEPVAQRWGRVESDLLGAAADGARHPLDLMRLGVRAAPPATAVARWLGSEQAAALFCGVAAHGNTNLSWPLSASAALGLVAAGHVGGWPAVVGGTGVLADAMVARLVELGGEVRCGQEVRTMGDLPPAASYLFDLTPWQVMRIAGDAVPASVTRAWGRFRPGNGSFKIDYALDGPMPWTAEAARRAGTVHLGGSWREIAAAEAEVRRGGLPERPYVLVAQQSLFDPSRAPDGRHTLWAYCHVPAGCAVDMSDRIEAQFDRFAPGWRDMVAARVVTDPAALEAYNANYVGGAIDGGASELHQVLLRPDKSRDPYRIGRTNLWLCSSSTPPGAGVHGLCGRNAARSVLRSS